MKIKWKNHELLLATMATAVIIAGYIRQSKTGFDTPFTQNHVPYNLFQNVLGPKIGMMLIIYLSYLFINIYAIPQLKKSLWFLFSIPAHRIHPGHSTKPFRLFSS